MSVGKSRKIAGAPEDAFLVEVLLVIFPDRNVIVFFVFAVKMQVLFRADYYMADCNVCLFVSGLVVFVCVFVWEEGGLFDTDSLVSIGYIHMIFFVCVFVCLFWGEGGCWTLIELDLQWSP